MRFVQLKQSYCVRKESTKNYMVLEKEDETNASQDLCRKKK